MGLGLADRSGPLETKVAASGFYRQARDRRAVDPRTVQIELLVTEAVRPALSDRNELRPEDVPVERIRAAPVRDGDHGMIELDRRHCRLSLEQVTTSLTLWTHDRADGFEVAGCLRPAVSPAGPQGCPRDPMAFGAIAGYKAEMDFRKFRGTDKYLTSSALESAVN